MAIPFTVSNDALASLAPPAAEGLAKRMILAEAVSAGVPTDEVCTSGNAPAPDGGVDIEVENAPRESGGGLIKKGRTAYQVKSGRFAPSRDIARTLFGRDGQLRDGIRRCLDAGGTFVVILTGWDGADTGEEERTEKGFASMLSGRHPHCSDPAIRVWGQGKIRGMLERHPHLAFHAAGVPSGLYTHAMWSSHPGMKHDAHLGPEQHRFVNELRGYLRADDQPVLVQVTGAPGAGKTRLVLEATRDEAYSGRIVYTSQPDLLRPLLNHMAVGGVDYSDLVIVVDDCTYLEQGSIWYEVQNYRRVKMVAITGEPGIGGASTCHLPVPDLGGVQTAEIIAGYTRAGRGIEKWIDYCRPSPGAAHIVGANLEKYPGDVPRQPESVPVWERHVAGPAGQEPDGAETRRVVLGWLSLFKTIRRGRPHEREIGCIAALAKEHDRISEGQFLDAVEDLRAAGVLRGESELCITPKMLHLHAWAGWWDTHAAGTAPMPDRLVEGGGSRRLFQSYIDMFGYAGDSPRALRITRGLLAPGGLFEPDGALESRLGADLFLMLSGIDPPAALSCIERAAGRAGGADQPGGAERLPDHAVHALARMLLDPKAFQGAMRLLFGLAARGGGAGGAGGRSGGYPRNPALDACCAALDPAGHDRAARGVPLKTRLGALSEAMRSESAGIRLAAARACGSVLAMRRASIALPCYEGAGHIPDPWTPSDRGEAVAYYLGVMDMLGGAAEGDPDKSVREEAARQAVETLWQAALVPEMAAPAVGLAERLCAAGAMPDRKRLLGQVSILLDIERGRMDAGIAARLAALRDSVEGSGFSVELRRLVGSHVRLGWSDPYREHAERAGRDLRRLAGAAVRDGLSGPDMDWLVSESAEGGAPASAFEFGLEVGARDARRLVPAAAVDAMRRAAAAASPSFLGGCLRAMRDGGDGGDAAEDVLDGLLADDSLCGHLPALTRMAGASDRGARRLARGVAEGRIGPRPLEALCYGGALAGGVSAGAFAELVGAVLGAHGDDPAGAAAALGLAHAYYLQGGGGEEGGGDSGGARPMPLRPALDILLHGGLFGAQGEDYARRAASWWAGLGIALVRQHPGQAARLAGAAIDRLGGNWPRPSDPYGDAPLDVLAEAARLRPREAWGAVAARLSRGGEGGDRGGETERALLEWIGEGGGAQALPMDDVIRWAEEEPDTRPAMLSRFIPPDFAVARDFVARFGGRADVRDVVSEGFLQVEYSGSILSHYAGKRAQALRLRDGEGDPNVRAWLGHHIGRIDGRIAELAPEAGRLAA